MQKFNEKTVAWHAVRCCCQPQKIFGFIPLESDGGAEVTIMDKRGHMHRVELRRMSEINDPVDDFATVVSRETAVYSDDQPIEFWRTIPGFIEVSGTATGPPLVCSLVSVDKAGR